MNYTPLVQHERNRYVEKSLDAAFRTLQDPYVRQYLGTAAINFEGLIEQSVVANVEDGNVRLPDEYAENTDLLPIYALAPGETVHTTPQFMRQSSRQQTATLATLGIWRPTHNKLHSLYDSIVASPAMATTMVTMRPEHDAVMNAASIAYGQKILQMCFEKPPKGFGLFRYRPTIAYNMRPGTSFAPAGVSLHELAHAESALDQPVTTIHSQRSADMYSLRKELEAYHAQAVIGMAAKQRSPKTPTDKLASGSDVLAMVVEASRREFVTDSQDPFKPTGALLQQLKGFYPDINLIHGAIDFAQLSQQIQAQEADTVDR